MFQTRRTISAIPKIGVIVLSQTRERNLKLYVIVKHIVKKIKEWQTAKKCQRRKKPDEVAI